MYHRVIWLAFAAACGRSTSVPAHGEVAVVDSGSGQPADTLVHLDLATPSVRQSIDPRRTGLAGGNAAYAFVQIRVAAVTNPRRHPLTFELRYEPAPNETTYLGSFSLYPADNPGTFIVATQGKLRDQGALVLSMRTPDGTDRRDTVRVAVRPLRLLTR